LKKFVTKFLLSLLISFVTLWALAPAAQAHGVERALTGSAPVLGQLGLGAEAAPVAARYAVTVERAMPVASRTKPQRHTWYFYRDSQRIALLKGSVDEVWYRDAQQRISFERVFHDDERVVDYSTGELATLQVNVDWAALSTFVDPAELAQLSEVSRLGQGPQARVRLRGQFGQERLTVDWLPVLQLPQRLVREVKGGLTVRIELQVSAHTPPLSWPQPSVKSANYLHLDAADFGDMGYDPVVRKSEALDLRMGWRALHKHH